MLTAQNVKDKTFEKAVFGGYDMAGVDQFMDEVADSITAMQKENAVLKSKMKVLVDKIEEYRSTEDAMHKALMSAQKMSTQIENEAKAQSEAMLSDATRTSEDMRVKAKSEADHIIWEAKNVVATNKAKINAAQKASADYIARMKAMCQRQMEFLESLDEYRLPEPEPEQDAELGATVKNIEESISKLAGEAAQAEPVKAEPAMDEPTQLFRIADVEAAQPEKKKFSFEDLRFSNDD